MELNQDTKQKVNDVIMAFRYEVFKLLTFNASEGNQILKDLLQGIRWVVEVFPSDLAEIEKRGNLKPKLKPKPVLRRRPVKKESKPTKPIKLKDFVGNKQIGIYRKRKKK